jgi:hypothetical protein
MMPGGVEDGQGSHGGSRHCWCSARSYHYNQGKLGWSTGGTQGC